MTLAEGIYDVAILGGGASGLAAAIAAAREGARVAVLERDVACGLTILATGNGRCNLSNEDLDVAHYSAPEAARAVMGAEPEAVLERFFASLGLMTCSVEDRLYPVTRRAETVRDVLLAACAREGVELLCGFDAEGFAREHDGSWAITGRCPAHPVRFDGDVRRARRALGAASLREATVRSRALVLAAGGSSSHVCHMLGLPHVDEVPVLCPIACESAGAGIPLAALDGLRVEGELSLIREGEEVYRELGEVLFRPYGISGIVAFNLSRRIAPGDRLELNLFPQVELGELMGHLRSREDTVGEFSGDTAWFDGMLARPLARYILDVLACTPAPESDGLRGDALMRVAKLCHALPFRVLGRAEERQAQARRGGIPFSAVDLGTLALAPGLYACGETLDQDADCGGFNLAWAWMSGMCAGSSAARAALDEGGRP